MNNTQFGYSTGLVSSKWKYPFMVLSVLVLVFLGGNYSPKAQHLSQKPASSPLTMQHAYFKKIMVFKRPLSEAQVAALSKSVKPYQPATNPVPQTMTAQLQVVPSSSIRMPKFVSPVVLNQYHSVVNNYVAQTQLRNNLEMVRLQSSINSANMASMNLQMRNQMEMTRIQTMMSTFSARSQSVLNHYQTYNVPFTSPLSPFYFRPMPSFQMPRIQPITPMRFTPITIPSFNNFNRFP
jgi:hypothetical protein